jgi:protocatechuate 3,4-dioxygenase beta subunit
VSTAAGPVAHQLVLVTLDNKTVRRVYTDSHGNYTLDSVPPGPVQVTASTSAAGVVTAGRTAVVNLKIP